MLNTIKGLIGIAPEETSLDNKINTIIALTRARLKVKLGNIEPPAELDYIITEVALKRYNRIGSEGMTSHSVEGETMSFDDKDFDAYSEDIQTYLNSRKDSKIGKVRFL